MFIVLLAHIIVAIIAVTGRLLALFTLERDITWKTWLPSALTIGSGVVLAVESGSLGRSCISMSLFATTIAVFEITRRKLIKIRH